MFKASYRTKSRSHARLMAVVIAAAALPAFGGTPTIMNVNTSETYASLQAAITAATPGDTIEIGTGVVFEHDILLDKPLTIRGQGMDSTTIDGHGLGGVLGVGEAGGEMTLEDFTIAHGQLNVSVDSGGLYVQAGAELTARRLRFLENVSAFGGGVGVIGSEDPKTILFADACEFLGNTAGGQGGGLGIAAGNGANVTLVNCLFRGNQSSVGSAVMCSRTDNRVILINCTLAENDSEMATSVPVITANSNGKIVVANCVVVGPPRGSSIVATGSSSLTVQSTLRSPNVSLNSVVDGGGNIVGTPIFEDDLNGNYRLAAGSPGIDAADALAYTVAGGMPFDLNGDPRFHDDSGTDDTGAGVPSDLDMGAYEFQGTSPAPCPGDVDGSNTVDVDDLNAILGAWNTSVTVGGPLDLANDDGFIDVDDLNVVLGNWGGNCG